jgi:DNA-binding NtrC family response regulator
VARILVIDDDESIRFLLRTVLELQGYNVVEAENGYEGLLYCQAEPTDVVITDMQMPVMDGLALITELRSTFPWVKVIAISGGRRGLEMARTFTRYTFEKPFSLEAVLDTVQELVATPMPAALGHGAVGAAAMSHGVQVMV